MRLAIEEAMKAGRMDEVPVGAVITDDNDRLISRAHNLTETNRDPTAHAEILAIKAAAAETGSWRLTGCTIYVTLEPCVMCAGAVVNSRMSKLVYGAYDTKAGAVSTLYNIGRDGLLNHRFDTEAGVLDTECKKVLQDFFRNLRSRKV